MDDHTRERTTAYDKTWKSPDDFADYLLRLADDHDESGSDSSADDCRLAARYIKDYKSTNNWLAQERENLVKLNHELHDIASKII